MRRTDQNPPVKTDNRVVVLSGILLFSFIFIFGGFWFYTASIAGSIIAQGSVAVLGKPKTIQHLDGGIVASIEVDDGDLVEKNELLVRLDDTLLNANLNIHQNRLLENVALRSRLAAERDGLNEIIWDFEILGPFDMSLSPKAKQAQERLFQARLSTRKGQISQLREQIKQYRNQQTGIQALKRSRQTQIDFLDDELEGIRSLNERGLSPKSQLMALERQREEIIGQIAEQDAESARIQNAIGGSEIQILQVDREFRQEVLIELRLVEQEINDLVQQLHTTVEQLKRVKIKAPVKGIVHELSVFTIGGVISASSPVLQIIPSEEGFEIEANVEPQFIDELYLGQPAILRFSAFNQRTTPELNANVEGISANVVVDDRTGFPFYKVRLSVEDSEVERLNDQPLIPGMPVETYIKTDDRTALNYLIKPLLDQISRAFREE
jgi:HlyD family secretion protein